MDLQTSKHGFTYQMLGGLAQPRRFGKTWMIGLHIYGFTSNLQMGAYILESPGKTINGLPSGKRFWNPDLERVFAY